MEGQIINRSLKKLIREHDLPDVVFHSFRHASITYTLKWNGGDMKSVQSDSGHARPVRSAWRLHTSSRPAAANSSTDGSIKSSFLKYDSS